METPTRQRSPLREAARWFGSMSLAHALLVAIAARIGVFLALHVHSHLAGQGGFNAVGYGGLDDGRIYFDNAKILAEGGDIPVRNSYPIVLSWLFSVGIDQIWLLKFANTLAGLAAVWIFARIATEARRADGHDGPLADPVVLLLAGLFPAAAFWSSNSLMRDGWIFLFVALALWIVNDLVMWKTSLWVRVRTISFLVVVLYALGTLRWYAVGVLAIASVAAVVTQRSRWVREHRAILVLASLPAVILVAFVANGIVEAAVGVRPLDYRDNPLLDGGSELEIDYADLGPLLAVPAYIYSVLSNAFGPFPFQARTALQAVPAIVELPFQIVISALLWRHRKSANKSAWLLFVFGLVWLLALGLWNDSLGNATRIRSVGWLSLAAAAGAAGGFARPGKVSEPVQEAERSETADEVEALVLSE